MNIQSWIILIVVAVLFVLAIIGDRRRHKSGAGKTGAGFAGIYGQIRDE